MMRQLKVTHITTYDYANPVGFGDHRMMFRPRDSHDLRILSTDLVITPQPSAVRWMHDVDGNSVAIASFDRTARQLRFVSEISLQHFGTDEPNCAIEGQARTYPFRYAADELPDLAGVLAPLYPDPNQLLGAWARSFIAPDGSTDTWDMLRAITEAIWRDFVYLARDAEGVQTPAQTLAGRSGTCRDFAVLMMEAVRTLGLAARFVSGYLYVPATDASRIVGGGATHAWTQVYLPGSGWVEFDPTNGIVGNRNLIRVAVARDPNHAVPLRGTFIGAPGDYLGMTVQVDVIAEPKTVERLLRGKA